MINLHYEIKICQKIYNKVTMTVYVKYLVRFNVNKTLPTPNRQKCGMNETIMSRIKMQSFNKFSYLFIFQVSTFFGWRRARSQVLLWCHRESNRVDPMVHCHDCLCRHLLLYRWHRFRGHEGIGKGTSHRLIAHDR